MTDTGFEPCNIGPMGIRRRLVLGAPLILVGVVGSFFTKSFLWQVVAFFGFLSFYQATARTCVALASRGVRNMDDKTEYLESSDEIAFFQRRSRGIYMKTFLSTLALIIISRGYLILANR